MELQIINNKQKIKNVIILIITAIIVEIVVCNFPAFRTIFAGNNNLIANYSYEDKVIKIEDIGARATSIYFEYDKPLTETISYYLKFIAEEDEVAIAINEKVMLPTQKHYIQFDTHSKCEEIVIELETNQEIKIKEIIINRPNFNINIIRILFIFGISFFIKKFKDQVEYKKLYVLDSEEKGLHFFMLALICVLIGIYVVFQFGTTYFLFTPYNIVVDDALLMQTEAFINGQIPILIEPSEKLEQLADPYDHSSRIINNIEYIFDMAYYDGNYYNYFGLTPIITLILPFRALTGMYTHTYIFNLVYIFGIVFLLFDVYKMLIIKYVKKVSKFNFYLGYFAMLFATNIFTSLRGEKYDIVTTSGIMFILLSMSIAMRIGLNEKWQRLKSIVLGISMALIVLSKPNFIVYYPLIIFLLWESIKLRENKEKIKNAIYLAVPLGLFAIFQMFYNYIRFDNPLEFGAQYQLTSFNMKYCMAFSFGKIYAGILEYIFKLPNIDLLHFPFVLGNSNMSKISVNEICYENKIVGLVAIPILWIFIFKKFILEKEDKELKNFTNISIITGIISIIINTCMAGITEPYSLDFKCIFAISAIILLLKNVDVKESSKEINYIFTLLCIITICIMLPITLSTEYNFLSNTSRPITIFLKNLFEFWT